MSNNIVTFTVAMPTDQGFIGRLCSSDNCGRYFKVYADSVKDHMYCPYCGLQFSMNEFLTNDQEQYLREVTIEKAREIVHKEINKMFADLARKTSRNKYVKFTHKPTHYRARKLNPRYQEYQVDSELACPECNSRFQVFGVFGYCPGCRSENLLIYDANLAIIKQEIVSSSDANRALRHAYSDLVSTFEQYCKKKAKQIIAENARFQILFDARSFFKKHLGIDILEGLTDGEILILRRVFQKRHCYEHEGGVINKKFIRMIPEDANLLDQQAQLSLEEFLSSANVLRRVLDNLTRAVDHKTNRQK